MNSIVQSVCVPRRRDYEGEYDQWMEVWPDLEIAVAFQTGGGPHECVCSNGHLYFWCRSILTHCARVRILCSLLPKWRTTPMGMAVLDS